MNRKFEEYVTSQAFALTLSKPMIEALRWQVVKESDEAALDDMQLFHGLNLMSFTALERRGLVYRHPGKAGVRVTEAGHLVYKLLAFANLVPKRYVKAA